VSQVPKAGPGHPFQLFQRAHIDYEPILHILLKKPLNDLVDLPDGDHFDVGGNVVPAAVIQQLSRFARIQ
jgi:hypothetical protein